MPTCTPSDCCFYRDSCPRQQNHLLDALECLLPEGCVPTLVATERLLCDEAHRRVQGMESEESPQKIFLNQQDRA